MSGWEWGIGDVQTIQANKQTGWGQRSNYNKQTNKGACINNVVKAAIMDTRNVTWKKSYIDARLVPD